MRQFLVVMAVDSMLRGQNGRKLEAGDFTTFTTFYVKADCGASASLTFEGSLSAVGSAKVDSSFKGNQTAQPRRRGIVARRQMSTVDSAEKPPSFERTTKNTKNESSRETSRID